MLLVVNTVYVDDSKAKGKIGSKNTASEIENKCYAFYRKSFVSKFKQFNIY